MPVQLPVQFADYGLGILSIVVLAWTLVAILRPRRHEAGVVSDAVKVDPGTVKVIRDPDLIKVISDNTQALTKLTAVIESQGEMIRAQGEVLQGQARLLTELRVEIVRRAG